MERGEAARMGLPREVRERERERWREEREEWDLDARGWVATCRGCNVEPEPVDEVAEEEERERLMATVLLVDDDDALRGVFSDPAPSAPRFLPSRLRRNSSELRAFCSAIEGSVSLLRAPLALFLRTPPPRLPAPPNLGLLGAVRGRLLFESAGVAGREMRREMPDWEDC